MWSEVVVRVVIAILWLAVVVRVVIAILWSVAVVRVVITIPRSVMAALVRVAITILWPETVLRIIVVALRPVVIFGRIATLRFTGMFRFPAESLFLRSYRCFLPVGSLLIFVCTGCGVLPFKVFFLRAGSENRLPAGPADDPYQDDPPENAETVDTDVLYRRRTAGYEGLMIFVSTGKAHTDDPGSQHQKKTVKAIYIEGKRNCYRQKKIFCHMSKLPGNKIDLARPLGKLPVFMTSVKDIVCGLDELVTDFIAHLRRNLSGLCGKRIDHIHQHQCRKEG